MPKLPKKTSLTSVEQYELNQWLQENNINPAKLRRSFTDVVPLARLLSRYYPELVDVNFYPPRNSVQSKLSNWDLFSKRVLVKLGLRVTREEMDRVARCVPGAIDLLLHNIMIAHQANQYHRRRQAEQDSDSTQTYDEYDDDEDYKNWDDGNKIQDMQSHASGLAEAASKGSSPTASILQAGGSPTGSASVESGPSNVKLRKAAAAAATTGGMGKQRATSTLARKKSMVEDKDIVMVNVRKQIGRRQLATKKH
ncbi:sperm flagellar protein 1-like [Drosophila willistoni]|uniref:sperm flagellar protein 1-like n=1 Tax=Drosophila willistoni TaxID=7260 RepID=UPI000C26CCFF|nr:sperm flagellar protein 1-like [Drosophila willistoni]